MAALRDLLRELSTTYAEAPYRKRLIQSVVVGALWLLVSAVMAIPLTNPSLGGMASIGVLSGIFVWIPGMIACTWATVPSAAVAARPIRRSHTMSVYDKYFGLNGEVSALLFTTDFSASGLEVRTGGPDESPGPIVSPINRHHTRSTMRSKCRRYSCIQWCSKLKPSSLSWASSSMSSTLRRPTSYVPRPTPHVPRPTSHVPHPTSHDPRPKLNPPSPPSSSSQPATGPGFWLWTRRVLQR